MRALTLLLALSLSACVGWPEGYHAPKEDAAPTPDPVFVPGENTSPPVRSTPPSTRPSAPEADPPPRDRDPPAQDPPAEDPPATDPEPPVGTKTGGAAYEHAGEDKHSLTTVLDVSGPYGVAMAGGHLIADKSGGAGFPRDTPTSSSGTITIPAGATVKHALLWYGGIVFLKPGEGGGQGDYTADVGGPLDSESDISKNGITFEIGGQALGPHDPTTRAPQGESTVGSAVQISPLEYAPTFGTWTGVRETVWANRLDITGLLQSQTGTLDVTVNPPERLDINGNDAVSTRPAAPTTTSARARRPGRSWWCTKKPACRRRTSC